MQSAEVTTAIASATAIGGILLKMAYDSVVEHLKMRRLSSDRFIGDSKAAYDQFLEVHRRQVKYQQRLHELALIARAGKEVRPGTLESFGDSSMTELIEALQGLQCIARTSEIVKISERIVSLHGDASAALRNFLIDESLNYGLTFFLARRLQEEQEREFIATYRKDLGLKPPVGAPKDYPVIKRPWPLPFAEQMLHTHVSHGQEERDRAARHKAGKILTENDIELLRSLRLQAIIADQESDHPQA